MHCRPFYSILLASALVLLVNASASAQVDTSGTSARSSYVELSFSEGDTGGSCLSAASDDNIVWGTAFIDLNTGSVCSNGASAEDDNIVWGTALSPDDNIVWGTALSPDDNIVWGTAVSSLDNIVWGTAFSDDNIVWGTAFTDDNIVWGTSVSFGF